MSNYRAIAAVTAVLAEMIGDAIKDVVPSALPSTLRPGKAVSTNATGVNVFLYRAVPNASLRNRADPIRASDGRLLRQPVAAWDLHYLLTCVGDEDKYEPDLLLGTVLTTLNAQPTLQRGLIEIVDASLADNNQLDHAAGSGLEQQVDLVRLSPLELTLEQMTQLWSSLTNEPYALSVAFQASAVLMSPELSLQKSLPVGGRPSLSMATMQAPTLRRVLAANDGEDASADAPLLLASTLVLEGELLASRYTRLRLGGLEIPLSTDELSPTRIEVALSPDQGSGPEPRNLAPGALSIRVVHMLDLSEAGDGSELRPGLTSNVLSCVLRPELAGPASVTTHNPGTGKVAVIEVPVVPAPNPAWDYALLLNELGGERRSFELRTAYIDDSRATPRLLFARGTVPAGQWLLRVQINDADSPLERSDGLFTGPTVTLS